MSVGKCGHCGHEPVATSAIICPNCHGTHPILAGAKAKDWFRAVGLAVAVLVVIGTLLAVFGFPN